MTLARRSRSGFPSNVDSTDLGAYMEKSSQFNTLPCRLFVLLAQEATIGVIFRRGPSKWVQLIKWDTINNTFEPGQWLHGKIYEQRSDLSPDESKLIYLAAKYGRRQANTEIGCVWTAISKPPYLTALALWREQFGTWYGGGVFIDNDTVMVDYRPAPDTDVYLPHPNFRPPGLKATTFSHNAVLQCRSQRAKEQDNELKARIPGASWAGWDQQERLVYAKAGKLFSAFLETDGKLIEHELADFNNHKPKPKVTPDWAKTW